MSIFDRERTPIARRFARRLLAVTFAIFVINHVMDYNFQERNALQDAEAYLQYMGDEFKRFYDEQGRDMEKTAEYLPYISIGSSDTGMKWGECTMMKTARWISMAMACKK